MSMTAHLEYPTQKTARSPYEVNLVRTADGFHALEREWSALYETSHPRNPMLSYEWAAACWTNYCPGAQLFFLTARHEGRLVGVAPLRLERQRGFRVLRFLGRGATPYAGFLTSPKHPEVEGLLLEALGHSSRHWDLLHLVQLAEPFTHLHHLCLPGSLRGSARVSAWRGGSYVAFEGPWEALCKEGPHWLKKVQLRVRKFEREGGMIERFLGVEAADHLGEIAEIEARSWKAEYGDCQASDAYDRELALLRQALLTLGNRGEMDLWLARLQGRAVAFRINLLLPDRLWLYRNAYNQDYAKLGVGAVLDFHAIRQAWQEGRREYDYLSGDEAYKPERTTAVRPVHQLSLHPVTPRGYLAFMLLIGPRILLKWFAPTRAVARICARFKNSTRALLAGTGAILSRVQ